MTKPHLHSVCLLVATISCVAGPAWAQSADADGRPRPPGGFDDGARSRNAAAEAVRRAQARSGGRVLGAERVQFDGRDIMRVKVMDESGRVRYMDDDPSAGRRQRRGGGAEQNDLPSQRPRGPNPRRP